MRTRTLALALLATAALSLGTAGPALAQAGAAHPDPKARVAGLLGRAVHAEAIVPDPEGGFRTVVLDRGAVAAATSDTAVVLDRRDGEQVRLAVTAETRFRGVADAAHLVRGRPATVLSRDGRAFLVVQNPRARAGNNS